MVEQGFCKAKVEGSNPFLGSLFNFIAGVAEWAIAPVCRTGAARLRGFESYPQH